ncbi:Clavaminate synthase-like protein [Viridothelium virens]|uniref:Clavaminate synthase-like protein n=1 Tax=Viridothelium virens TaxID=1048519 RepID=A0A6A6HBE6_VIRVR|nr:Clavaminate synthase-like protein [Viridothelium virens]
MPLWRPSLGPDDWIPLLRQFHSKAAKPLVSLSDGSVEVFREHAFRPAVPAILPKGSLHNLPAVSRWFERDRENGEIWRFNTSYLSPFGKTMVPVEVTQSNKLPSGDLETKFLQQEAHLTDFIEWCEMQAPGPNGTDQRDPGTIRLYLAQASLSDLPGTLRKDLPTPGIVESAGRGDVYNSNIWIGMAPTDTPLHKDPNPNLFVQLAGRKVVRLYEPSVGMEMFRAAQMRTHDTASASFRGAEMMQGEEKKALEDIVWGNDAENPLEAHLNSGDAIFIPRGWWHSIKGVGKGLTASVNWWFR